MANFDDLKLAVEMLSGGTNTVIYDDIGMPSIMVRFPKLLRSELIIGDSDDPHPAFLMDGNEQAAVYESKYQNIVANSRAYSLPMQDPSAEITFDAALTACRKKGDGWGIQPASLWSAIALWCNRNNSRPRGNNNYGRDIKYTWEKGVATTTSSGQTNHTATGSGPATWYHDGTYAGIADLNGNVLEWCAGFRLVKGELQVIPYANSILATCDMGVNSAEWKAIDKDGNYVAPGSANTLKLDYISSKWQWITGDISNAASNSCAFGNVSAASTVSDNAKKLLRLLTLLPEDGNYDHFYANNGEDEQLLVRGGCWYSGDAAGVCGSNFDLARSSSSSHFGFRSAFYGTL
ncbi:hypothetical protein EI53_01241 [Fusobacterium naviforme]|nr:hypothetical protein F7P78_06200 [Fusobacterium naviforme]PSL10179.1 hypothetical protein EI53_01241 [Fusobacterium naviforme]STO27589.1 Uncharacterised protein [Fusobacterium naviforme]